MWSMDGFLIGPTILCQNEPGRNGNQGGLLRFPKLLLHYQMQFRDIPRALFFFGGEERVFYPSVGDTVSIF